MNKTQKTTLKDILKFVEFTHQFQQVKRIIYATGEERDENDAEHSFQLAMVAWYLIETKALKLNQDKVIKYSLVHDLVEVYAGDTFFYSPDTKLHLSKAKREKAAVIKIKKKFAEFVKLGQLIDEYELKANAEAKFVYALDKIIPVFNVYLDQGRTWKREKVTYQMARTKDEKVAVSPQAQELWQEVIDLLDKNLDFFHSED